MRALKNNLLKGLVYTSVAITIGFLVWIVGYIFIKGAPGITVDFIFNKDTGIYPMIISTLYLIGISLSMAVPIGIFAAIYLTEYAKQGKLVKIIRFATECLSGIPSIIYGLFGMLLFVTEFGWSWSLLAGACTVAIMILPTVIRTTEEAIKSVPAEYKEGSYGLGASKLRTIVKIILPSALPGIMAAVILSVGRVVGETAALVLTAGTVAKIPSGVMSSGRSLSVHLYMLAKEGASLELAFATAMVLIIVVAAINFLSDSLMKIGKNRA